MPAVNVYIPEKILQEVERRGENRSRVVSRDLGRLYYLYNTALKEIDFTIEELCLVFDALNGALLDDAKNARLFWASVEDAIKLEKLDIKWGVDGKALVEKLVKLTDLQKFAVIDLAERFWTLATNNPMLEIKEAVQKLKEE